MAGTLYALNSRAQHEGHSCRKHKKRNNYEALNKQFSKRDLLHGSVLKPRKPYNKLQVSHVSSQLERCQVIC